MVTYEQIKQANESLNGISMKDKTYVMVAQRVRAFRMLYPEGFITTDIISNENGVCLMKSEAGYYNKNGHKVVLGSGMAYEKESSSFINKTSYIENCETSSVGRALGFLALGIDGGSICSAEELANALNNQKKQQAVSQTDNLDDIRGKLDIAIRERTKDMSRDEKVHYMNTVIMPALDGERNWRTCPNHTLLQNLLAVVTEKAA